MCTIGSYEAGETEGVCTDSRSARDRGARDWRKRGEARGLGWGCLNPRGLRVMTVVHGTHARDDCAGGLLLESRLAVRGTCAAGAANGVVMGGREETEM